MNLINFKQVFNEGDFTKKIDLFNINIDNDPKKKTFYYLISIFMQLQIFVI